MLDGLEITQFTYFQQCGGIDLDPICAELTYGLERIAAFLQDVDSIYDIVWARDPQSGAVVKYRDVRYQDELQMSVYNFEKADVRENYGSTLRCMRAKARRSLISSDTVIADQECERRTRKSVSRCWLLTSFA